MKRLFVLVVAVIVGLSVQAQGVLYPVSPLWVAVPERVALVTEARIGSFRPTLEAWECPLVRVGADVVNPLVRVVVDSSGRVENWPIPRSAQAASGDDGHLCVMDDRTQAVYEFWRFRWQADGTIRAGGAVAFPYSGTGISNPPNRRVTASGFANTVGMVRREDFINPATGLVDVDNAVIRHALTMALPWDMLSAGFVSPAVGAETLGSDPNGIPMGARFVLPQNVNVDALNVDPVVKALLRAARDYGIYISDGSGTASFQGKRAGVIEVEPGLLPLLYGRGTSNDTFSTSIQRQVFDVLAANPLQRVIGSAPGTPTPGAVLTATSTPASPTLTAAPTVTATPAPGRWVIRITIVVEYEQ